jgi:hypothetical protein
VSKDPYWDELGIAWVAIQPQIGTAAPLKNDLQRQTRAIGAAFALASIACVAGGLLGTGTIWVGATTGTWNFVARGIAILMLATLAGIIASALSVVRSGDEAKAVSEMIELSVRRAKNWLLAIRLALLGCGLAAALGLIGVAIRTHFSAPPKMSPVVDLVLLALSTVVLGLCHKRVKVRLAKFEYLQKAFGAEDAQS